jgi:GNAT superfamily N-acetyltransferase
VPLDTELGQLPQEADCLYLHDIALRRTARGSGAARDAVGRVEQLARQYGLDAVALVSLPSAKGFWQKVGYAPQPCRGLQSYGDGVSYMERDLSGLR